MSNYFKSNHRHVSLFFSALLSLTVLRLCYCSFIYGSNNASSSITGSKQQKVNNNNSDNNNNNTTTVIIVDDGIVKKSTFSCPLLDLKIKYVTSNQTKDNLNFTQLLIDNPSQFSCETFPFINDYFIWYSPYNSTNDKIYGVSDGKQLLCDSSSNQLQPYFVEQKCQYFSNISSNEMQFFFPRFEHLVLYDFINYNINNIHDWGEIYDLNNIFFTFLTCFYCTNGTSVFKTKIYPNFVANSKYEQVRNSQCDIVIIWFGNLFF